MTQTRRKIDLIVGTRPNIVKLGPLASALSQASWCEVRLVFLQQHQHPLLVDDVITDMGLSTAEFVRISADSTDWGGRIGEMVSGYSALIQKDRPHVSVVFGDVDATLAAAYAAKRAGIALAHVEAGLRSHDMRMPEELNRRMVD